MSYSPLASPSATRAVLDRHGFSTKKSLGQNFLVNDDVIGKIVALAEVRPDDAVLEIGPGIGTLTWALLDRGATVAAIERDPALPAVLDDTLGEFAGRFTVIGGDAVEVLGRGLKASGYAGSEPTKLVSNLPYAVAATVVLDAFQKLPSLESTTVMVQREVAERMTARPGTKNYGAYTVKLSLWAEPTGSFAVGPNNFMPRPRVDSTVIRLDRREAAAPRNVVEASSTMADAAFFARRKTIANSCRQYFSGRDKAVAAAVPGILAAASIDPRTRGETLTREQYLQLGEALLAVQERSEK